MKQSSLNKSFKIIAAEKDFLGPIMANIGKAVALKRYNFNKINYLFKMTFTFHSLCYLFYGLEYPKQT